MATFEARLRELRRAKGITQEHLSKDIGVTKCTVSIWERGIRKPEFETLDKLSDYFGVTLAYLLGDDVAPTISVEDDSITSIWAEEDEDETLAHFAKMFVRLSPIHRRIVAATITAAYKEDSDNGILKPDDAYIVSITSAWVLEELKRRVDK